MSVKSPTLIKVCWKKHSDISETNYYIKLDELIRRGECEETLVAENTFYYKNNKYLPKKSTLLFYNDSSGNSKKVGKTNINLTDYLEAPAENRHFPIKQCEDKNAEVILSIKTEVSSDLIPCGVFIDYFDIDSCDDFSTLKDFCKNLKQAYNEQVQENLILKATIRELELQSFRIN